VPTSLWRTPVPSLKGLSLPTLLAVRPQSGTSVAGVNQRKAIVSPFGDQKSRLGQIVLGSNGLQHCVIRKAIHRHHRSGISREPAGCEGVNLEYRCAHGGRIARTERPKICVDSEALLPATNSLS
jgi:hypothetical protein